MTTVANVGNFASGTIIAAYLGMVVYRSIPQMFASGNEQVIPENSNLGQLLKNAEQDYGYIEFLIAAGIVSALYDVKALKPIIGGLFVLAALGFLLSKGPGSNVLAYLKAFGSGKIGLFGEKTANSQTATPSATKTAAIPPQPAKPALPAITAI